MLHLFSSTCARYTARVVKWAMSSTSRYLVKAMVIRVMYIVEMGIDNMHVREGWWLMEL